MSKTENLENGPKPTPVDPKLTEAGEPTQEEWKEAIKSIKPLSETDLEFGELQNIMDRLFGKDEDLE